MFVFTVALLFIKSFIAAFSVANLFAMLIIPAKSSATLACHFSTSVCTSSRSLRADENGDDGVDIGIGSEAGTWSLDEVGDGCESRDVVEMEVLEERNSRRFGDLVLSSGMELNCTDPLNSIELDEELEED